MIGKGMYNTFGLNDNADLIIADGDNYYNCYLMPGINNAEDVATEQLAYWRIEKIEKTSDKSVKTPEDFLKQFNTDLPTPDKKRPKDVK